MTLVRWQSGRGKRSVSSPLASRPYRCRHRFAARTLEQCEERVLMASILGSAQTFAVLGASTVTNTGPSVVVGNVGVSPGTAITGLSSLTITDGSLQAGNALAAQAHADLVTAYNVIAGETSPAGNDLTGTDLGGLTLTPGVYSFATSASLAAATTLTLNAEGDPNARFDFQIGTTLITGSDSTIQLINGARSRQRLFPGRQLSDTWHGYGVRRKYSRGPEHHSDYRRKHPGRSSSRARWRGDDGYQSGLRRGGGRIGDEDDRGRPRAGGQHPRLHHHGGERRPQRRPDAWRSRTSCRPTPPSSRTPRPRDRRSP